jgi:primosomal protein N' (replication factor Y)
VQVPLGPRQVLGVVWDGIGRKRRSEETKGDYPCRSIARHLAKDMRAFLDWVATYTVSPPGLVARMALRAPAAFDPEPMIEGLKRLTDMRPERMTSARERVIATADNGFAWTRSGSGACRRYLVQRHRRTDGAGRVRNGVHPAAARGGSARSRLCGASA